MKILVIGAGTIGLPFGLLLAEQGHRVVFTDSNCKKLIHLETGTSPLFNEPGVAQLFAANHQRLCFLAPDNIEADYDAIIFSANISNHPGQALELYQQYADVSQRAKLVLFRSTLNKQQWVLLSPSLNLDQFCYIPERSRPGNIIQEIKSFPQIIGFESKQALSATYELLHPVVSECIEVPMVEAIAIKLLANSWRASLFDLANHFFLDCQKMGVSFEKISNLAKKNYPRLDSLPLNGFISGPCLEKDYQSWELWKSGEMPVQDGLHHDLLQAFTVALLQACPDVSSKRIALYGKSYRVDSNDDRDAPAYRVQKIIAGLGAEVQCFAVNEQEQMISWGAQLVVNMFPRMEKINQVEQFDFWSL